MNSLTRRLLTGSTALAVCATMGATVSVTSATASPDRQGDGGQSATHRSDNRPGPQTKKQQRLKTKALALLENGKATLKPQAGGGSTVKLADGSYVEFPIEKTDKIFTILSEFGDTGSGKLGTTPGPLHNQIPEPDRATDNSTYWVSDFSKAHFEEMFNGDGESFKNYYTQLSSGRYTAINTVTDWVKVPGNASTYGDNAVEDNGGSWSFINDSADSWYQAQLAAGQTPAQIDAYLAQFDEWDRYDFDGDGDFTEADGYIDHFQAVHAGEGEEAGADADAIWSHRWYVGTGYGTTGPSIGTQNNLGGGAQIGGSKYFIGDYTVEPENGGLGVFAHEFGHDLGLPDYYDTAGGENGSAFWTLMSSGSWLSHGASAPAGQEGIGTVPGLMGPEEKLFLGWLDHTEVNAGQSGTYKLGPSQHTYAKADQAIKVNLPNSTITNAYTTPPSGTHAWWSGRGDDLSNTLTRTVPASSSVTVTASAWYEIEAGYDYLYAQYSLDGGQTWTNVGNPIDGSSRNAWTGLRYSYKAGGQESLFRFLYKTDGGYNEAGAFLDDVTVKGSTTFTDGAESGTNGWDAKGWTISTGTDVTNAKRYYLIENRQYVGYDATLQQGPYQFSNGLTKPNWVEFFPFQDGMLVWYVDESYTDNNVSAHPGAGAAMVVDATPNSLTYPDGSSPSNRREPFDATFGLDIVDRVCLHKEVAGGTRQAPTVETLEACAGGVKQKATFDDTNPTAYYDAAAPQNSVKVAGVGVKATVTGDDGTFLTVAVSNPAAVTTP
ncbi:immune inhibitor A domain-containing protein [Nocardioides sp. Soil805]|uniref:immune inhibitor A domain-containing protein n=1 Tax=Nocardioides sp. Soil805 TaxID=1736416 RepID=UPI0007039F45|nr:immune inhibitor A domain-containing protein [Nocardioides sp. Soil805]KRF30269.1 peptidase M6 [Nocardioides sp. Soil805]